MIISARKNFPNVVAKIRLPEGIDVGDNMGKISRRWINEHREELKDRYDDKIVLVCRGEVIKVLNGSNASRI